MTIRESCRSIIGCAALAISLSACAPAREPVPDEASAPSGQPRDGTSAETPVDTLTTDEASDADTGSWTAGIVDVPGTAETMTYLTAVRFGRHVDHDRVVVEFRNVSLPGYHIEYVDEPVRACGSGDTVPLPGQGWLAIRLSPASAHTDAGESLLASREREANLPILARVTLTCDFEGVVTWVLAVTSPNRYRVIELSHPARLVVDIRH